MNFVYEVFYCKQDGCWEGVVGNNGVPVINFSLDSCRTQLIRGWSSVFDMVNKIIRLNLYFLTIGP